MRRSHLSESPYDISVADLCKTFSVPEREAGLRSSLKSLVRRKTRAVRAVDAITFDITPGEVVGFLGPNGAGKTTTLKMLSGLLYPTSGTLSVLGYRPSRREKEFLRQITLIMGNRNQLQWDLPALDSFELNRAIYPNWLQVGLTFLVPVAFAVTVPAEALTGRITIVTLFEALALTILLLLFSRWFWKLGLRYYSGASA